MTLPTSEVIFDSDSLEQITGLFNRMDINSDGSISQHDFGGMAVGVGCR